MSKGKTINGGIMPAPAAKPIPLDLQIWSARDIANYLGLSQRHVAERLVYQRGFPRPMKRICKSRQWRATEVIAWRENPPVRSRTGQMI